MSADTLKDAKVVEMGQGTSGQSGQPGVTGMSQQALAQQQQMRLKEKQAQLKQMKIDVEENEIKARYWKAKVETMKYSIEYEALEPDYNAHLDRMREKERKQFEDFQAQLKKGIEAGAQVKENETPEGNLADSKPE